MNFKNQEKNYFFIIIKIFSSNENIKIHYYIVAKN